MLQKNIDREERKKRNTWVGYYQRSTKSLKEKKNSIERKHRANELRKAMREAY
jgi:hypothetical protein